MLILLANALIIRKVFRLKLISAQYHKVINTKLLMTIEHYYTNIPKIVREVISLQ